MEKKKPTAGNHPKTFNCYANWLHILYALRWSPCKLLGCYWPPTDPRMHFPGLVTAWKFLPGKALRQHRIQIGRTAWAGGKAWWHWPRVCRTVAEAFRLCTEILKYSPKLVKTPILPKKFYLIFRHICIHIILCTFAHGRSRVGRARGFPHFNLVRSLFFIIFIRVSELAGKLYVFRNKAFIHLWMYSLKVTWK